MARTGNPPISLGLLRSSKKLSNTISLARPKVAPANVNAEHVPAATSERDIEDDVYSLTGVPSPKRIYKAAPPGINPSSSAAKSKAKNRKPGSSVSDPEKEWKPNSRTETKGASSPIRVTPRRSIRRSAKRISYGESEQPNAESQAKIAEAVTFAADIGGYGEEDTKHAAKMELVQDQTRTEYNARRNAIIHSHNARARKCQTDIDKLFDDHEKEVKRYRKAQMERLEILIGEKTRVKNEMVANATKIHDLLQKYEVEMDNDERREY